MRYDFNYNDSGKGYTGKVDMCIINVQVNKDRTMQFNFTWHLVSFTGPKPNRYVYGRMVSLSLVDDSGNRYPALYNSGKEQDRDENKDGVDTTSGWYLFPTPVKWAQYFTLYNDYVKNASIPYISFISQ